MALRPGSTLLLTLPAFDLLARFDAGGFAALLLTALRFGPAGRLRTPRWPISHWRALLGWPVSASGRACSPAMDIAQPVPQWRTRGSEPVRTALVWAQPAVGRPLACSPGQDGGWNPGQRRTDGVVVVIIIIVIVIIIIIVTACYYREIRRARGRNGCRLLDLTPWNGVPLAPARHRPRRMAGGWRAPCATLRRWRAPLGMR